jgi:hypothetical protein
MLDWKPISSAPFDRDLEISVIKKGEVHALVFPCRAGAEGKLEGLLVHT